MSSTKEQIFYDLDQTPERIDFTPCKKVEFKNGTSNIKSDCTKETYIRMPRTGIYGFSLCHDPKIPAKDRTVDNANGLQICVNLTSKDTVEPEDHTPSEKRTYKVMNALKQGAIRAVKKEFDGLKKGEKPKATPAAYNGYRAIKDDVESDPSQWDQLIKPIYGKPNKKGTQVKNLEAPDRVYMKLLSYGGGGEKPLNVKTNVFDEDDNQIQPLSYIQEAGIGEIEWIFRVDGLYWGAHGPENPWQLSITLRVTDITFYPSTFNKPPPRMLPSGSKTKGAKKTDPVDYPDVTESDFDSGSVVTKKKSSFDTPPADDDSDTEEKPKKTASKKKKSADSDEEGNASEEEKPKKTVKKTIKKKTPPPADDDSDTEEKPKKAPVKKTVKKTIKKKKAPVVEEDDDE